MGTRTTEQSRLEAGGGRSSVDAVRRVIRAESRVSGLSAAESAALAGHLTALVARVDRVRSLGATYADVDVSRDVRELLARLEVGSSLTSGVH